MRHPVVVWVGDPRVEVLRVEQHGDVDGGPMCLYSDLHHVPPDDRLVRDVDTVRRYVAQRVQVGVTADGERFTQEVEPIPSGSEAWEAMDRLSAAFGLGEGSE